MNLYFTFANLTCRIFGPKKQLAYLYKCYKKSPFSQYVQKKNHAVSPVASLRIMVKKSPYTVDEFMLESHSETMTFVLRCTDNIFFLFPIIEQVLRKIYYLLFFKYGGLILHASAVVFQKKAYIFCGPSGAGKSTIAMKLVDEIGSTLVADNNVYLRCKNDDILLYPPPFLEWNFVTPTSKGKNSPFTVDAFFFIKKSKKTYKEVAHPTQILRGFFDQIQFPKKSLTTMEIKRSHGEALRIAMQLMSNGKLTTLYSTKNGKIGQVVIS